MRTSFKLPFRWLLLAVWLLGGKVAMAQTGNLAKIDPELQEQMHQSRDVSERFRVIVEMAEQYDNPNLERGTALMTRAQRRDYVVNELKRFSENSQAEVVGFLTNPSTRGQVNVLHRFWIFNGVCCEATAECIGELSMRQDVRFVSLDKEQQMIDPVEPTQGRGNQLQSGVQWHVHKINADFVWTLGYTGEGVVVAVIDTGVNYEHEDISANMWDGGEQFPHHGWDFYNNDNDPMDRTTESGHGTHVAGIVAGHGASYKSGVAPGATIMALKVFGDHHSESHHEGPSISMACQAIEFAVEHGADVLNLSFGADGYGGSELYRNTFVSVMNAGVVATISAGNVGNKQADNGVGLMYPVPNNVGAPGNCPPPWRNPDQVIQGGASAVICVGATNKNDIRTSYSSFGPVTWAQGNHIGSYHDYPYDGNYNMGLIRPDVVAPGGEYNSNGNGYYDQIISLSHTNESGYCTMEGTSMASPCVAGVIALMLDVNPYLTPTKIDEILETTAKPCNGQTEKNNYYGAGRVNALSAVTAAHNANNMPITFHIGAAKYPERDCYEVGGAGHYVLGSTCTLLASPGNHFLRWEKNGETVSTDPNYTFVVGSDGNYIGVFDDVCKQITLSCDPPAASNYSGHVDYMTGATCALAITANEGYEFDCLTLNGVVVSRSPDTSFVVTQDLDFVSHFRRRCTILTGVIPSAGGSVSGGGIYLSGNPCTVTATPNVGYAFQGWYNSLLTIPYSLQPEYTFTVTQDRTLMAKFTQRNYTVTSVCTPPSWGSVSGEGTYPANSTVTLIATPTAGHRFLGWVENGTVVSGSATYTFQLTNDRALVACFGTNNQFGIGSVVTNADGSQGVIFHIDPSGVGWMVAMDDASEGCQWGPSTNVQLLPDRACDNVVALEDLSGFRNTGLIRTELGTDNDYAASQVNFDHGWYLPSAGQLRKLYSALPFIDSVLYSHNGTVISEDTYWSSTEYSSSNAASPMFAMSNSNKSSNFRVRAIRNYFAPQDNMILAMPDSPIRGEVMNYNNGVYSYGANVVVVATPKPGYVFDHWSEEGLPVSYNTTYTFTFTHSRRLVAHFVVSGSIGTVVHNADGSDGVVFYVNTDGTEGLMVALEDVSEGCQWGASTNVMTLTDRPLNDIQALEDVAGYHNTGIIRASQGNDSTYAAGKVDFENGWYLPASGELRKLYAALPLIETALVRAGGTTLTEDTYWSSTEYSTSDASTPMFSMGNTNKTSTCRVRVIRKFLPSGINSLVAKSQDTLMGTATGSGTYAYNENVTVSAEANEGFVFESWTEDGLVVSYDATYQFPFTRNRVLVANFRVTGTVGEIVHNADGSTGVVFYQNADGTEGWMVALEDASEGCAWGPTININTMPDMLCNDIRAMEDVSGYSNTDMIRKVLGTNNDYAASVVDFANGWYLPSAGQLRKLYAALPMIEESILNAGGTLLTEDAYWSSTEYNTSDACSPMFAMSNTNKASLLRVRAVRTFNCSSANSIRVKANNVAFGAVTGSGNYSLGATVRVVASPNPNYVFDHWEEDGCVVSYNRIYRFTFTRTRTLVAVFVRENSVGSVVHNTDGTTGVIFYTYPSGIGGLMVALEDVSEGCPWGLNEDITIMDNQSPSAVMDLLNDMCGKSNTNRIREWYSGNTEYAACKTDFANGWYLPSVGQLRKLYAALPLIERAIVNGGGTTLTEDAYWSSTEHSASNAWTPMFAMSSTNKTNNCRVRAIRSLTDTETILANVNIEGGGTVTGAGWYDHGQTCTLKAQANESYAFLNWTCGGSVVSTNMEYSFTVLGNQTYTANFVANSCNITTAMDPAGSGTVTGAGVYAIGSTCNLTVTPHTGYTFSNWTKGNNQVSTQSTYSFTVTESAQYTAHFVINSYAVNATAFPEEGGTVSGAQTYSHGSMATLTATPAEGYTFVNWTENGVVVSTSSTYQFVVSGNRTLQANFSNNAYSVTAIAYPENGGTVMGGGVYEYGTVATLTAIANFGYEFFCWFEDDDIVSFDPSMSFEVTEDCLLYAVFVESSTVTQTIALFEGWNWFSTYLDITMNDLKAALVDALPSTTSIKIQSQSNGNTTYNGSRWRGQLNSMDLAQMYMVEVATDCEITLQGMPVNPAEHPVTIHNGTNWIAFPFNQNMTLTNAFAGFAVNGDMVISQTNGSSTYTNRWRGALNTLKPGNGYLYKSNVQGNRTFTFPIGK